MARLRSIFLTSGSPGATAKFYRDVAGLDLKEVSPDGKYVYWRIDEDGLQIAIHDAELFAQYAHPPEPGSNLTHLYFSIADQSRFLDRLKQLGIEPFHSDEFGVTVTDPDGRKVLFGIH